MTLWNTMINRRSPWQGGLLDVLTNCHLYIWRFYNAMPVKNVEWKLFNDVPSSTHFICESGVLQGAPWPQVGCVTEETHGRLQSWRAVRKGFQMSACRTPVIRVKTLLASPCKVNEDLLPRKIETRQSRKGTRFRVFILQKLLHLCRAVHCRNVARFGQKTTLQTSIMLTATNIYYLTQTSWWK